MPMSLCTALIYRWELYYVFLSHQINLLEVYLKLGIRGVSSLFIRLIRQPSFSLGGGCLFVEWHGLDGRVKGGNQFFSVGKGGTEFFSTCHYRQTPPPVVKVIPMIKYYNHECRLQILTVELNISSEN